MYILILAWAGAGLRDCLFGPIMVGEPAPTGMIHYLMGGGGFSRLFI